MSQEEREVRLNYLDRGDLGSAATCRIPRLAEYREFSFGERGGALVLGELCVASYEWCVRPVIIQL